MVTNSATQIKAPVIILSSPRAGSTLLFETLSKHPQLWTIGGESHALIEHIPQLSTVARGYVSNRLTAQDASADIIATLRHRFQSVARNYQGQAYTPTQGPFRLLEKTPKNALRVAFLKAVFPDAKFVYLVRDPRENISSIMQAWQSNRFVTYPNIAGSGKHWSLLLPDQWQRVINSPLVTIARYQWQQANEGILDGLDAVPNEQKMILTYRDFIAQPTHWVSRIAKFSDIPESPVEAMLANGLALSRYTLTRPQNDKWRQNINELRTEIPKVESTVNAINAWLTREGISPLTWQIEDQ